MNTAAFKSFLTNFNTPDGKLDYHKAAFPVISIIISFMAVLFIIIPQAIDLTRNQSDLADQRTQADNLNSKVTALNSLSTTDTQTSLTTVNRALPLNKDYIDSTIYIQSALEKSQSSLTGLTFSDSPATGAIDSYKIKIDIEGSLDAINVFLSQIDRSPRILKISKVELTSSSSQSTYSATISISAFYSAPKKPTLSPSSPVVSLTETELEQIFQLEKNFKTYSQKTPSGQIGRPNPFN